MSRSGSEPVPSSVPSSDATSAASPLTPLEPQWRWRSFPNPTTRDPRPEIEQAHAQDPAPESEPVQQEDEVQRALQELLSESPKSSDHMLSQEGLNQGQDPALESPDYMSSQTGLKQNQEPAPAQSPEQSHQQASMQGIARGQEYVHIAPQNLSDDDDDMENPIVLRV